VVSWELAEVAGGWWVVKVEKVEGVAMELTLLAKILRAALHPSFLQFYV